MRLRTRHLACLILLLSTLGAAQASVSGSQPGFYGNHIAALLYRHAVDRGEVSVEVARSIEADDPGVLGIASSGRAALRAAWAMRPAAAQSAAVFAATSFARRAAL